MTREKSFETNIIENTFFKVGVLLLILVSVNIGCAAQSFSAVCRMDGETYEDATVSMGYVNFGNDEEPEYVWCLTAMTGATDEVDYMEFFGSGSMWTFDEQRPFFNNGNTLAIVSDAYTLRDAGKDVNIYQIGTYGANIEGSFTPQYVLLTIYTSEGKPENNYWIPYSTETSESIYGAIKSAIEDLDIPRVEEPD